MLRCFNLTLIALALSASLAAATPQSPDAFLKDIYSHYGDADKPAGAGVLIDSTEQLRRYFTPDLVALIDADERAAEKKGDVPSLDGDPFIDAQDWQITDLVVHIDTETAHNAKATVTFRNVKQPQTVHLDLVQTPKGWRISDIFWKEGSLRGLYKKK
jgi:Protein of unknown function (DUF3828)